MLFPLQRQSALSGGTYPIGRPGGRGGDCGDGRKSGVGRKILQRFTAEAKRRGTGKIHLEASQKGASLCRNPRFEALIGFTQFKEVSKLQRLRPGDNMAPWALKFRSTPAHPAKTAQLFAAPFLLKMSSCN